MRTDSLERALKYKDVYLNGIKQVLGADDVLRDTASLKVPK